MKNPKTKRIGGQLILGNDVEEHLVKRLIICGEWGYPLDTYDLRLIVKGFLDRQEKVIAKFSDNMPGLEWAQSFLKRYKEKL